MGTTFLTVTVVDSFVSTPASLYIQQVLSEVKVELEGVTAARPLSSNRMVMVTETGKVDYADSSVVSHAGKVVGLITQGAVTNGTVQIIPLGVVMDSQWTWDPTKPDLYLGTEGRLTQTLPTSGFINRVGTVCTSTIVLIKVETPIITSQ